MVKGKRSRGKQPEKMLDGLAKWLNNNGLISVHARSFNVTGCCVVVVVGAGVVGDAPENETTLFTDVIVILYFYRHVLDNFFFVSLPHSLTSYTITKNIFHNCYTEL